METTWAASGCSRIIDRWSSSEVGLRVDSRPWRFASPMNCLSEGETHRGTSWWSIECDSTRAQHTINTHTTPKIVLNRSSSWPFTRSQAVLTLRTLKLVCFFFLLLLIYERTRFLFLISLSLRIVSTDAVPKIVVCRIYKWSRYFNRTSRYSSAPYITIFQHIIYSIEHFSHVVTSMSSNNVIVDGWKFWRWIVHFQTHYEYSKSHAHTKPYRFIIFQVHCTLL